MLKNEQMNLSHYVITKIRKEESPLYLLLFSFFPRYGAIKLGIIEQSHVLKWKENDADFNRE